MKKIILNLLFIAFSISAYTQVIPEVWYFGDNCGLDFSGGAPVAITDGQFASREGGGTWTDASGNLLFYSSGGDVWDRNHTLVETGLVFNDSRTQNAVIIPRPANPNQFYIFHGNVQNAVVGSDLYYSTFDLTLGANGDIVPTEKNVSLLTDVAAEKLTAVPHANGQNYWLMSRSNGGNTYYAFLVDPTGVNTTPVTSNAGAVHSGNSGSLGALKCRPDGRVLACASSASNVIDLMNFDNCTGIVTNGYTYNAPAGSWVYGLEFSPDGTRLYNSYVFPAPMGLNSLLVATGVNTSIESSRAYGLLQTGPDGLIYTTTEYETSLSVINFPDNPPGTCGFNPLSVDCAGGQAGHESRLGLPQGLYSIGYSCGPPPILATDLLDFDARKMEDVVNINWVAVDEMDIDRYDIERSSDGMNFEYLAEVKSNGSFAKSSYFQKDIDPLPGTSYYRLKIYDDNGDIDYSEIRKVVFDDLEIISFFPNPANEFIKFSILSNIERFVSIDIYNTLGQNVLHDNVFLESGMSTYSIETEKLSAGHYVIKLQSDSFDKVIQQQFIKQ